MLISRQGFDGGRANIAIPIMRYLAVRRDEAFTADEIFTALLDVYGRRTTIAEVINPLRNLVNAGRIGSREIAGFPMYTIKNGEEIARVNRTAGVIKWGNRNAINQASIRIGCR